MNYQQSLDYLARLGNEVLTMKFGLRNIETLLQALGRPQHAYPSVLIAGTNGKGSVAAMIESILRKAGFRTGLYTSPHLIELRERFCVGAAAIQEEALAGHLSNVADAIETLLDRGELPAHPTYFETITAVAFDHFRACRVDIAVLEVGMGGRLDSTNVVTPEVTAVTTISRDHTQFLGETLEQIAAEKAGILKPGVPAVIGWMKRRQAGFFEQECLRLGCPHHAVPEECWYTIVDRVGGRHCFVAKTPRREYPVIQLGLLGKHQVRNALVALRTCEILAEKKGWTIEGEQIVQGLEDCRWPGRLETFSLAGRALFVDGAHNEEAIRQLVLFIRNHLGGKVDLVFGIMRDKDLDAIARLLAPVAATIYLPKLEN
ncbi:MAG: bifunctional folylpolyglutamate synthase/dihydrofolate synthase, partial [Acidobacteriota bacterium]